MASLHKGNHLNSHIKLYAYSWSSTALSDLCVYIIHAPVRDIIIIHKIPLPPPSPSTPLLLVDRLGIECVYTYMYNVDNKYIYNQKGPYYILISESPLSICKGLSSPRGTGQGTCSPSLLIKLKRGCVEMFGLFMQKEVV